MNTMWIPSEFIEDDIILALFWIKEFSGYSYYEWCIFIILCYFGIKKSDSKVDNIGWIFDKN